MKVLIIILFFLTNNIFADYSEHPEAQEVIETLVRDHGFEKSYVIQILKSAKKQEKILQSMSSPAEFTWTWDRYKKLFIEVINEIVKYAKKNKITKGPPKTLQEPRSEATILKRKCLYPVRNT